MRGVIGMRVFLAVITYVTILATCKVLGILSGYKDSVVYICITEFDIVRYGYAGFSDDIDLYPEIIACLSSQGTQFCRNQSGLGV